MELEDRLERAGWIKHPYDTWRGERSDGKMVEGEVNRESVGPGHGEWEATVEWYDDFGRSMTDSLGFYESREGALEALVLYAENQG